MWMADDSASCVMILMQNKFSSVVALSMRARRECGLDFYINFRFLRAICQESWRKSIFVNWRAS
jgi:hypothetical protein